MGNARWNEDVHKPPPTRHTNETLCAFQAPQPPCARHEEHLACSKVKRRGHGGARVQSLTPTPPQHFRPPWHRRPHGKSSPHQGCPGNPGDALVPVFGVCGMTPGSAWHLLCAHRHRPYSSYPACSGTAACLLPLPFPSLTCGVVWARDRPHHTLPPTSH